MRTKIVCSNLFGLLALLICNWSLAVAATDKLQISEPYSGQRHVLVTFTSDEMLLRRRAGSGFKGYGGNAYRDAATARFVANQLSEEYALRKVSDWPISALDVHCVLYEVAQQDNIEQLIARLNADPRIESVQAMQRFELQSANNAPVVYNDPYFKLQSGWHDTGLDQVHRFVTGKGVQVALIDTAVEPGHPDLTNRIRVVKSFLPKAIRSAGDFHGTAMAGVVAAEANNHIGIVGVAPDTELFCLEACWHEDGGAVCNSFTLAQALNYAIEQHVRIINLSLAGPEDPLLHRLLDAAIANGISVIAADSGSLDHPFPASVPGVIAAGRTWQKLRERSYPYTAQVLAPAQDILTTVPGKAYDFVSGNSIAAAYVSGVVALLYEWQPSLRGQNLPALLKLNNVPSSDEPTSVINVCYLLSRLGGDQATDPPLRCEPLEIVTR
jgi:subtilisin family serine protease